MKIIDLSAEVAHNMVRYPSAYLPEVGVVSVAKHETHGRSVQLITVGTHISTHIDAPFHALPDGKTVDQLAPEIFVGKARVFRLKNHVGKMAITREDLEKCAGILETTRVIFDTGWAKKTWGTREYFTEGPFLTRDASQYLATTKAIKLLGMDFPNVDCCEDMKVGVPAPNHQILFRADIVLLENLLNLHLLDDEFLITACPLKVKGGDGTPTRVFGVTPLTEISALAT